MQKTIPEGEIRVGVLGAFRGKSFADTAAASGMKLVAICDNFRHRLDEVCGELKVPGYEDFDEFIQQDFDAVMSLDKVWNNCLVGNPCVIVAEAGH